MTNEHKLRVISIRSRAQSRNAAGQGFPVEPSALFPRLTTFPRSAAGSVAHRESGHLQGVQIRLHDRPVHQPRIRNLHMRVHEGSAEHAQQLHSLLDGESILRRGMHRNQCNLRDYAGGEGNDRHQQPSGHREENQPPPGRHEANEDDRAVRDRPHLRQLDHLRLHRVHTGRKKFSDAILVRGLSTSHRECHPRHGGYVHEHLSNHAKIHPILPQRDEQHAETRRGRIRGKNRENQTIIRGNI